MHLSPSCFSSSSQRATKAAATMTQDQPALHKVGRGGAGNHHLPSAPEPQPAPADDAASSRVRGPLSAPTYPTAWCSRVRHRLPLSRSTPSQPVLAAAGTWAAREPDSGDSDACAHLTSAVTTARTRNASLPWSAGSTRPWTMAFACPTRRTTRGTRAAINDEHVARNRPASMCWDE